ncbi:MAG: hypothetical protein V4550_07355 [Gemmatimonadota bacterium]
MTAGTKSALLLGATLLVGMVLGAAGAGSLDRQRRERLGGMGRPPGLARHIEEVINPRDGAQAEQLRPIIQRAAERNQLLIRRTNDELRASIDSMRAELDPLLDADQRDRLARATRELPPFGRQGGPPGRGGRGGPPPDGPPPFGPPPRGGPPPP